MILTQGLTSPVCMPSDPNAPPPSGEMAPRPVVITGLPAWIFPLMNSIAFDNAGDIALPAIGVESTIFSFPVPKGQNGVIKEMGNVFIGGGFTDGSGAVIWRIRQNTQPVRGKENIINSLGSIVAPSRVGGGGFIRILENDIIDMTLLNVSVVVAGQTVGGRLSGWFYPKDEDPQGIWF